MRISLENAIGRPLAVQLVLAALVSLSVSPAATAASPPGPVVPAIQQYVEQLPTSKGEVVAGSTGSRVLPAKIARKIDRLGGKDATALKAVASSARYGAPKHLPARTHERPVPIPSGAGLTAAAESLRGRDSHTLAVVVGAVLATTLAGGIVALRRRRSA